jgi:hypothetical protein
LPYVLGYYTHPRFFVNQVFSSSFKVLLDASKVEVQVAMSPMEPPMKVDQMRL